MMATAEVAEAVVVEDKMVRAEVLAMEETKATLLKPLWNHGGI
jgi:hypothetical protein